MGDLSTGGSVSHRYPTVEALVCAYLELDVLVSGIRAQDPAVSLVRVQSSVRPPEPHWALDAWMAIRTVLERAHGRVMPERWAVWSDVRVRRLSTREAAAAYRERTGEKVSHTTIAKWSADVDTTVGDAMTACGLWRMKVEGDE